MQTRTTTLALATLTTLVILIHLVQPAGRTPWGQSEVRGQELPAPDEPLAPPEGDFVGMTKCAACHYAQFRDWKTTAHGQAFEILPQKYRNDESCLACHSTGFGHAASSEAAAANLAGVSCEACHGPGGEHTRYGLTFVGQGRELTDESLKVLRSKIQRMAMDRCVTCHASMAHKPHPEFDREATTRSSQLPPDRREPTRSRGFFEVHR